MSNAAIYFHPDGYDTRTNELVGRHAAGESFLRGLLRHADVEQHFLWNVAGRPQAELDALLARIEPPRHPVTWIANKDRHGLGAAGVTYIPSPQIEGEAWLRRPYGSRRYAICGVTHTTATSTVMRLVNDLLIAPVEGHDALICTSSAVRQSVETQLDLMRDHMLAEYGPRRRPEPQRATIPLGVNTADFSTSAEHRKAWRERLDIPDDAIVALYVGRFNVREKMNPVLMALALERAAQRTGKPVYWVNSGWLAKGALSENFHSDTRKLCPSVHYRDVDGRPADVRFSIWSVADIFISLSDNIQETFGLTPVEAMAAGLPCVVSDWNGYKDTVRHGVDGFRVPTLAPPPRYGGDLAYWFANEWISYPNYVGATAQYTAVDLGEAETALAALIEDPDLRRRMGHAARERAREVFDWAAIIPQYQALWAEQDARRRAAGPDPAPGGNPYRPDPYVLFAGYPSRHLGADDIVVLVPGMDLASARARLDSPLATYARFNRPLPDDQAKVIAYLAEHGPTPVARLLEQVTVDQRNYVYRGLIWMARYDVLIVHAAGQPPTV